MIIDPEVINCLLFWNILLWSAFGNMVTETLSCGQNPRGQWFNVSSLVKAGCSTLMILDLLELLRCNIRRLSSILTLLWLVNACGRRLCMCVNNLEMSRGLRLLAAVLGMTLRLHAGRRRLLTSWLILQEATCWLLLLAWTNELLRGLSVAAK